MILPQMITRLYLSMYRIILFNMQIRIYGWSKILEKIWFTLRKNQKVSMAKTRGGIIKRYGPNASKNKKNKAEEVFKASKKKKIVVEKHESNSDSDTMAEIDNYQDSYAQSSDDVESSNDTSDSEVESSTDTQTGNEDEDPCLCQFVQKSFLSKDDFLS
ncbi:hypothetical protein H5410_042916 [Solanum commersonii]|uniref:Uncharacterized protein n=1 Tax=Solanum commersonii TaxID=4109 RepID=A0A9J5XXD7_SOLCO|nr:hypothetical protein H5410_042916 [Solanum commersonii]